MESDESRVIGRYALFGELASGGMATVHFGRLHGPVGFSRVVAIKRLHRRYASDPAFVSMFLDEARLAARVRHPNVVQTLDVVAAGGEVFLVMDLVHGESLAGLLRTVAASGGDIDFQIVAAIASGALHGLHAAHEAKGEDGRALGLVHRDVSPQNILVGVDGTPRVLDFGIAKATTRLHQTASGEVKGKLAYMAPEQLNGGKVTRATDIFAAGIVLWESITRQRLFTAPTPMEVVDKIFEQPIPPPSTVGRGIPEALDEIVLRALQRDPASRYATAREMAIDLQRRIGIAAPSDVGEWVEATAGDALTTRARRVANIERPESGARTDPDMRGPVSQSAPRSSAPTDPYARGEETEPNAHGEATEPNARGEATEPNARSSGERPADTTRVVSTMRMTSEPSTTRSLGDLSPALARARSGNTVALETVSAAADGLPLDARPVEAPPREVPSRDAPRREAPRDAPTVQATVRPPARRSTWGIFVVLGALVAVAGVVAWYGRARPAPSPPQAVASAAPETSQSADPFYVIALPPPPTSASAPPTVQPSATTVRSGRGPVHGPAPGGRDAAAPTASANRTATPRDPCDPPFVVDENGKHYKPECLRPK